MKNPGGQEMSFMTLESFGCLGKFFVFVLFHFKTLCERQRQKQNKTLWGKKTTSDMRKTTGKVTATFWVVRYVMCDAGRSKGEQTELASILFMPNIAFIF